MQQVHNDIGGDSEQSLRQQLAREIARREEAERLAAARDSDLADFLDNAAVGIHRVGADGRILWANKAELALLGYSAEEYVGRHIADFHVDAPVIETILAKLLSGETLYDQPARLRCRDGSIRHVQIHSNGSFEDGQLRYTRCFTRDATARHERDQAVAQREKLLAELTAANRNKDQFLAMLGHELRNPLAPIVLALEIMERRGDEASAPQRALIRRQVDHLVRLVDDLLDIARVTQGKVELQAGCVDVAQAIDSAVEIASAEIGSRRHQLQWQGAPGLYVAGDAVRLAQVIANLLVNAARYTPAGGTIGVQAGTVAGRGAGEVRIVVTDNGRGMSAAELRQVFDLFYQGQQGIERAEGGLGVGLSLAQRLVALHGGRIVASSLGAGQGSEFAVYLPAVVAPAPSLPAEPVNLTTPAAMVRRTILLVDDNVDAAHTLGELLTGYGHTVHICHEPQAALDAMAYLRPDIAILDIGLPGMSGHQLGERIRALPGGAQCRLIALSGYGQPGDLARSDAAGFERHIVKPVRPEALLALLAGE